MQATNHAIQDESSYWVDGSEFKTMILKVMVKFLLMMLLRQSFNIPALKTWQQVKKQAGNDAPKKFASKVGLDYNSKIGPSEVLGGSSSEFSPTISFSVRRNC